jgi:hypothetical protein
MRFFLFILANAMLFIRPSELLPDLGDFELYRYVILACLLASLPIVLHQVFARIQGVPPIAGCVLALFPAVILSHVTQGNADEALEQGIEFFKVLVYFLLMLALLTTTARLRQFLLWLGLFCGALAFIAVVRYHASLGSPPEPPPPPEIAAAEKQGKNKGMHGQSVVDKVRDQETGDLVDVQRMCGTGIFNDPNDLALVLITAIPLCGYWLTDPNRKALRPVWIALILLLGYALMLTHSRGGLLALMAGTAAFLYLRFGGAKTMILGLLVMPVMLLVFAGRMTDISASEGTGQTRIQLWCDAMQFFQQAPLFGIGMEMYHNVSYHVPHNSYLHCYAELGVVGGTLFLGAFYFALYGLYRVKPAPPAEPSDRYNDPAAAPAERATDPELARLQPYLLAMLVAYAVGIAFLSRSYIVPTYLLLGLAVVYLRMRSTGTVPAWCKFALAQMAGVSVCFLATAYVFVRMFVSWH